VSVYFYLRLGKQLRYFVAKELIEKMIFYCYSEALKVFPKYRCHPVEGKAYYLNAIEVVKKTDNHNLGENPSLSCEWLSRQGTGAPSRLPKGRELAP
jgi:hypothetical protein